MILYLTVNSPDKQHTAVLQDDTEYKVFTYIITEIDDTGYYGKSEDGKTGIYFTSENVNKNELNKVNEGSKVLTYFEKENHIDGIVKVEVIEWKIY